VRGEREQILAFLRVSSTRVGHLHVSSIPFIHIHLRVPISSAGRFKRTSSPGSNLFSQSERTSGPVQCLQKFIDPRVQFQTLFVTFSGPPSSSTKVYRPSGPVPDPVRHIFRTPQLQVLLYIPDRTVRAVFGIPFSESDCPGRIRFSESDCPGRFRRVH